MPTNATLPFHQNVSDVVWSDNNPYGVVAIFLCIFFAIYGEFEMNPRDIVVEKGYRSERKRLMKIKKNADFFRVDDVNNISVPNMFLYENELLRTKITLVRQNERHRKMVSNAMNERMDMDTTDLRR